MGLKRLICLLVCSWNGFRKYVQEIESPSWNYDQTVRSATSYWRGKTVGRLQLENRLKGYRLSCPGGIPILSRWNPFPQTGPEGTPLDKTWNRSSDRTRGYTRLPDKTRDWAWDRTRDRTSGYYPGNRQTPVKTLPSPSFGCGM